MERDFEKDPEAFKELFVYNWKHKANGRRYPEVGIRNEFYNYVRRILTTDDNHFGCVTTYINNVLEQHFRDCKEAINKYLEMNDPIKKMR